jgi:probable HAF family extracellular repeat protein
LEENYGRGKTMKTKLIIFSALLSTMPFAHAAAVLDLGDLGGPSGDGAAYGISADGSAVVGYSCSTNSVSEAFRWTQATGMEGLGDLPGDVFSSMAFGASADGQVVAGRGATPDGDRAFRWTAAEGMVGLPGTGPDTNSFAGAVSGDGSVIVGSMWGDGNFAFRWTAGSGMVSLDDFPGGLVESAAYGVSADGSVVVGYGTSSNGYEVFRWTATNGLENLGDLPGGDVDGYGSAVTADGQVIVGGSRATNGNEAFRWTRASGMVSLGVLPGFTDSEATAVSADGNTIVGFCWDQNGASTAFVWSPAAGMQKLADVLAARGADLSGWQFLLQARGISADGRWVCGYGKATNDTGAPFLADLSASIPFNIMRSNTAVIVSWPQSAPGWSLEFTTNLTASGTWTEIPPPYQTNGANLQFTEPSPVSEKFYRLRNP